MRYVLGILSVYILTVYLCIYYVYCYQGAYTFTIYMYFRMTWYDLQALFLISKNHPGVLRWPKYISFKKRMKTASGFKHLLQKCWSRKKDYNTTVIIFLKFKEWLFHTATHDHLQNQPTTQTVLCFNSCVLVNPNHLHE